MKINDFYLNDETLKQMKSAFDVSEQFTHVQLSQLYTDYSQIKTHIDSILLTQENEPLSYRKKSAHLTQKERESVLTAELQKIVSYITGKKIETLKLHAYGHTDYSMLLDTDESADSIDIIIDLSDAWDEEWGGSYIYADETGEYIELPANPNSITMIKTKENEKSFLKYVNHYAQKSMRKFLFCSFRS